MAGSFEKILRRQLSAKDFAWAPKGIPSLPFRGNHRHTQKIKKVKDDLDHLRSDHTEIKKKLECLNDLFDISQQTDITKLCNILDCAAV